MLEQNTIHVEISSNPLLLDSAMNFVQSKEYGGISNFIGTIRQNNEGKQVSSLFYESHLSLAEKMLLEIAQKSQLCFRQQQGRIWISHRIGELQLAEIAVIVAVATKHRNECIQACQDIIEEVKATVPIWKKENYIDGEKQWLDGTSLQNKH